MNNIREDYFVTPAKAGVHNGNRSRPLEPVRELTLGWIDAVRPSRRPLRGLLRMRDFFSSINDIPHAEERRRARLEGRTTSMQRILHRLLRRMTEEAGIAIQRG